MALYKKFGFEPINLCFECDQKRRLCFRNERSLYVRKCDGTGEQIVSTYSPDKPYKVYRSDYWYGDKWDAIEFGRDFDFSKTFFEQMKELQLEVPRLALFTAKCENSEYCNMAAENKNCYLVFGGDFNQDCMYGTLCMHNVKSMDCDWSNENEWCYEVCDCMKCYGCQFCFDCNNCSNCYFVSDCIGCDECILCTNLVKKSYCINNTQYSKDEYFAKKKELINGSYDQKLKNFNDFLELRKNRIVKYAHIVQCQNSDGDYLKNCKNCHNVFDGSNSQDVTNVIESVKLKDGFNCSFLGHGCELCYNVMSTFTATNAHSSFLACYSSNVEYCDVVMDSNDMFGCIGMRRKQYCILNKQYKKSEYEALRAKIVEHMKKTGEWGEFLAKDLSCFGYNESTAHDYFPMTKDEAIAQGFNWHEEAEHHYKPQTYKIPDTIGNVSDDICTEILACEECGKNFKIVDEELKFYKKLNIAIPRKCSDCRHKVRVNMRNPRKTWNRKCENCGDPVKTTYAPERSEKVYCEKCYLAMIV